MTYLSLRIKRRHHVQRLALDMRHQTTGMWAVFHVHFDDFSIQKGLAYRGPFDPAFQKPFQGVLMPMDPSAFRGGAQGLNITGLTHARLASFPLPNAHLKPSASLNAIVS
jgi:hypothetical protein